MNLPDESLKKVLQLTRIQSIPIGLEDKIMKRVQHMAEFDKSMVHVLSVNYATGLLLLAISAILFLVPGMIGLKVGLLVIGKSVIAMLAIFKTLLVVFSLFCLVLSGIIYFFSGNNVAVHKN